MSRYNVRSLILPAVLWIIGAGLLFTVGPDYLGSLSSLALLLLSAVVLIWACRRFFFGVPKRQVPFDLALLNTIQDKKARKELRNSARGWEHCCEITGMTVDSKGKDKEGRPILYYPTVMKVREASQGFVLDVAPALGQRVDVLVAAAPGFARLFGTEKLEAEKVNDSLSQWKIVIRDPLAGTRAADVPGAAEGWVA